MSNYTVQILKQMINAGVKVKPADCPDAMWNEANTTDVAFEEISTSNAVTTVETPANNYPTSYGLDSFGAGTSPISVDATLKIKSGSLMVNGKEVVKLPFRAKLLVGESKFKKSIKVNQNGSVQYFSTYGGGIATNGMPWMQVVAQCKAMDSTAYEYDSADLCFELIDELKGLDGAVVAGKGQRIGYTTASTNKSELVKFKNTCMERGLNLATAEVEVKVGFKLNSNKNNQSWTTITLEVL